MDENFFLVLNTTRMILNLLSLQNLNPRMSFEGTAKKVPKRKTKVLIKLKFPFGTKKVLISIPTTYF